MTVEEHSHRDPKDNLPVNLLVEGNGNKVFASEYLPCSRSLIFGDVRDLDGSEVEVWLNQVNFGSFNKEIGGYEKWKRLGRLWGRLEGSFFGFWELLKEKGELGDYDELLIDDILGERNPKLFLRTGKWGMEEKKGGEDVPWVVRSDLFCLDVVTGKVRRHSRAAVDYLPDKEVNWDSMGLIEQTDWGYFPTNRFLGEVWERDRAEIYLLDYNFSQRKKTERLLYQVGRHTPRIREFCRLLGGRNGFGDINALCVDDLFLSEAGKWSFFFRVSNQVGDDKEKSLAFPSELYKLDANPDKVYEYCGYGSDYNLMNRENWTEVG